MDNFAGVIEPSETVRVSCGTAGPNDIPENVSPDDGGVVNTIVACDVV